MTAIVVVPSAAEGGNELFTILLRCQDLNACARQH